MTGTLIAIALVIGTIVVARHFDKKGKFHNDYFGS